MISGFHLLHPGVQRALWEMRWTELRPIQERAIHHLLGSDVGGDVVISSRTASGKTEAAFLPVISAIAERPTGSVRAMYVGPLKALINDQFRRVEELCERLEVPVCKWHGDVGSNVKDRLLGSPAGVLLITPESLEAMLVLRPSLAEKVFGQLAYVVIDEMHAFMGTERGAQLVCQLHRIASRARCDPTRIGLSATLGAPEAALSWLRPGKSATLIADGGSTTLQLRVEGLWKPPPAPEAPSKGADPTVRQLARSILAVGGGKTNLVFANAKAAIELLADALATEARAMDLRDEIVVHHGSLSRDQRLSAEQRLRDAAACTAVCSNTLEMGIDIGSIDMVIQVSAPSSVAALTQRVGRSGRRGSPRILRGFFSAQAPTGESTVWDRLHLDVLQGIAAIELLLAKFAEPASVGRAHLSTLVHQCLAFLAEAGGAGPKVLFDSVVGSGAFGNVSTEEYKAILRGLKEQELIDQMADGKIILGLRGEEIVGHYTFFATFSTQQELRVVFRGEEIGTVSAAPETGAQLTLGGRRWRVDAFDPTRREVTVSPSKGGGAPSFTGSSVSVHAAVHQKMRALLLGEERPAYLDRVALEILGSARAEAAAHSVDRGAGAGEGAVLLYAFAGTRVQRTLALILAKAGLKAVDRRVGFEVQAPADRVASALCDFVADPDMGALAGYADDKLHAREQGREKLERFVAPEVWRRAYAAEELDKEATVVVAEKLADALGSGS